jgi:hypothetical protein
VKPDERISLGSLKPSPSERCPIPLLVFQLALGTEEEKHEKRDENQYGYRR